jgi:hypothetical protein
MRSVRLATAQAWLPVFLVAASATGQFRQVTGKEFDAAFPKDFYLEGNSIPTEKRNAALLRTPAGARLIFALLDTTGYSSAIQQKYLGMMITEGAVSICGNSVGVGSYGFGLDKPKPGSDADAGFNLYDQAGAKVAGCTAKRDAEIKQPRPFQVVLGKDGSTRLYLGRFWIELK